MTTKKLTKSVARKVLSLVDQGLTFGLGKPEPGKMCVEAAVCYALGEPHGDQPSCVAPAVRSFKIALNDAYWSSNRARAKGMRRLAIAQLGSADIINDTEFAHLVSLWAKEVVVPRAANYADYAADAARAANCFAVNCAAADAADAAKYAADNAANYAARGAANAAYAAAYAAKYAAGDAADAVRAAAAARDKSLAQSAEEVVQILIEMGSPGTKWLDLAPLE